GKSFNSAAGLNLNKNFPRTTVIEKFPFMIHFTIDDNHQYVDILALFHTSRNPMIWEGRENKE
ncbi:hypothetical protein, partial [Daejeonella sp.]|uniref:hypothetical protein n=1 Tax=Daejeonella sp. TaxID=2805397 RepID=UPI002BA5B993